MAGRDATQSLLVASLFSGMAPANQTRGGQVRENVGKESGTGLANFWLANPVDVKVQSKLGVKFPGPFFAGNSSLTLMNRRKNQVASVTSYF